MIPMQDPGLTTAESRRSVFSLLVALDSSGHARGELYVDDGQSIDNTGCVNGISFHLCTFYLCPFTPHLYCNTTVNYRPSSYSYVSFSVSDNKLMSNSIGVSGIVRDYQD